MLQQGRLQWRIWKLKNIHSYELIESTDEANTGGAKVASFAEAKNLNQFKLS